MALFSSTFRLQSSDDDDNDGNYSAGSSFRRFDSSLLTLAHGDLGGTDRTGHLYTSTPLLHGGAFHLSTDPKEPPSSSLGAAPDDNEERGSLLGDDNLDMGRRPTMREMARRIRPVTSPYPTPPSLSYYRR